VDGPYTGVPANAIDLDGKLFGRVREIDVNRQLGTKLDGKL
jgi:hypothetical protein